jgi:DNA-binding IclR family transcriptional regulator
VARINRPRRSIRAMEIGMQILHCLSEARKPIPLKAVVDKTGFLPSNVHFYLTSLVETGLARQEPETGDYALGPYALQLGLAAMEQVDAISTSRHLLYRLSDELEFSAFLNVWGSHGPTVVYRVDGKHRTVLEIRVGSILPVLRSGAGRVFLAYLPSEMTEKLVDIELMAERSGKGTGAPQAQSDVKRLVRDVRRAGLARASGTLLTGFTSLAAPIWDHAGTLQTVISIVGPIGVLDDSLDGQPAQTLLRATRELSAQMGWRDDVSRAEADRASLRDTN